MDPLWYKNAVIYQMHVKSFFDSNEDGVGDFVGLTKKLDYIESIGITAIWLLPFFPSPLKDDGYDISNYLQVHHSYGSLKDFRNFLQAAHERGIRVIIELVVNHTSEQHDWFQRARLAPKGSTYRNFYIWSDTPDLYKEARIIFKDFETSNWAFDPVASSYYFHRFYSHQPDLNYENPLVQKQVFRTLDFWLQMGVDGLRLDAVPYLFKREGTNCENLPETHGFIKKIRKYVDDNYEDRVLIAEANQWPEDAAAYFGKEDECHMAFHFPVMPRLFMAIQMEDRFPIIDILEQTPALADSCQWAMFLRNHDELTLEMVSDGERDYMYRIYAKDPKARLNLGIRRRLAPLLENDRAKIELMNVLLFSLPGTPVIYYGDEIGMGDNYYLGDRNGVRTPMQWNSDRNAGFSKANPHTLYLPVIIDPLYHYELVNVENQEHNPSSLLWWVRRTLQVRKNYHAFGSGALEFIAHENHKVLAFVRQFGDEIILIVANLSRFSQAAELNLAKFSGFTPQELFHQNPFPTIKEEPYTITLGPYGYFWLSLKPSASFTELSSELEVPKLIAEKRWVSVFSGKNKKRMEREILPAFIQKARWFEHKALTIQQAKIVSAMAFANSMFCIWELNYLERLESELYLVPISYSETAPEGMIARVSIGDEEGFLYDSIHDERFRRALLNHIVHERSVNYGASVVAAYAVKELKRNVKRAPVENSRVLYSEQSNSSIVYQDRFILKLFRRLEEGTHPEVEVARFLTEKAHFSHVPKFEGSLHFSHSERSTTLALLQDYIPNEGTAWDFTLDELSHFYEQVLTLTQESTPLEDLIGGSFLEAASIIGERSAQMHIKLASDSENIDFKPEPFSYLYQRSLYQDMRHNVKSVFHLLKNRLSQFPDHLQEMLSKIVATEPEILNFFQRLLDKPFSVMKTRVYGDYHLGQLLYTGKDFFIIDFEGEPLQSLPVRRRKCSPLGDVAGMLRSFHYAAFKELLLNPNVRPDWIAIPCYGVLSLIKELQ